MSLPETNKYLALIANAIETVAGASTVTNNTEAGFWKRIAAAAEVIAGASTTANANQTGYMKRARIALDTKTGFSSNAYNATVAGYLSDMIAALESNGVAPTVGSLEKRLYDAFVAWTPGGAPTITTAPTIVGNAVVGQPLFTTAGSYSAVPTSIDLSWKYEDGSVIPDETNDNYLTKQFDAGLKVRYIETAHFGGTTLVNQSALSPVIAARTLGAVQLVRTSGTGVAPLTYTVTLPADTYPGDLLVPEVATNSTFATINQAPVHMLTAAEIATPSSIPAALTADGLTDPGSTEVMRVRLVARVEDDSVLNVISQTIGKNYAAVVATDNFDDGIKNTTLWGADGPFIGASVANGATVTEASARTEVQPPDSAVGYIGRISANAAAFRAKFVEIERLNVADRSSLERYLRVGPDKDNGYGWYESGGNFFLYGWNAGTRDNLGSFADPDYASGAAPVTYGWVRLWNDYVLGVKDDIVILTAPPGASKPPTFGQYTEKLRVARSNSYWNQGTTPNLKAAFGGGQWNGSATPPSLNFDNFNTDMAL